MLTGLANQVNVGFMTLGFSIPLRRMRYDSRHERTVILAHEGILATQLVPLSAGKAGG
jgi:hypothetical protein